MNISKAKSGFTLTETIIAITVITLIITAAYDLVRSSLNIGRSAMNQFTAHHLAEEGLETVRNARDSNWLQNKFWRDGLNDGTYSDEEIILDGNKKFTRIIEIESAGENKDSEFIRVKSAVYYKQGAKGKNESLVMELTDWKKGPL